MGTQFRKGSSLIIIAITFGQGDEAGRGGKGEDRAGISELMGSS